MRWFESGSSTSRLKVEEPLELWTEESVMPARRRSATTTSSRCNGGSQPFEKAVCDCQRALARHRRGDKGKVDQVTSP